MCGHCGFLGCCSEVLPVRAFGWPAESIQGGFAGLVFWQWRRGDLSVLAFRNEAAATKCMVLWTSRGGYSSHFGTWVEGQGSRWSGKHRVELHDMRLTQHLRQHAIVGAFAIAFLFHSFCTSHSVRHETLVRDAAPHHSTSSLLYSTTSAIDLSLSPALNSRCTLKSNQPSCTLPVCTSLWTVPSGQPFSDES